MSWHLGPMLAFDTETDGPDPLTAHLVTACAINLNGTDGVTSSKQWLAAVEHDIPDEAAAIHGVTTEHARTHGRPVVEVLTELAEAIGGALRAGIPVVGHNVVYDLTVLQCELARWSMRPLEEYVEGPVAPVIDTLCLDRSVDKYRRGKRTLTATAEHYGVRLDGAHDATQDALASARIAWKIASKHPKVAALSLRELHAHQVEAYASWAAGFQTYLRKTDPAAVVDAQWPVRVSAEVAA